MDYRLIPRLLRWCRRFRQRKGYGVHSPFAFEWITEVVYNQQANYYAYAALSQHHDQWQGQLSQKDAKLLFRMANHMRAQRILWVGAGGEREMNYLRAARPSAQMEQRQGKEAIDTAAERPETWLNDYDFVVWAAPQLPLFKDVAMSKLTAPPNETAQPTPLSPTAVIVFFEPHASPARHAAWEQMVQADFTNVSFDLHRFGVAFHYPKLQQQHYKVNYF